MAINANVFGGVDTNGDAFLVVGYRDDFGSHTILMPIAAAEEFARTLLREAARIQAVAARMRTVEATPSADGGSKPS